MQFLQSLKSSIQFSMVLVSIAASIAFVTGSLHFIMILAPLQASLMITYLYLASRRSRYRIQVTPAPPPWFFRLRGPLPIKIVYFFFLAVMLFGLSYYFQWPLSIFLVTLLPLAIVLFSTAETQKKKRRRHSTPVIPYQAISYYESPYPQAIPITSQSDEQDEPNVRDYRQGYQPYGGNGSYSPSYYPQESDFPLGQYSPYEEQQPNYDQYEQPQALYPNNTPPDQF